MEQLQETLEEILERVEFKKMDQFEELLHKCIHVSNDSSKSTYAIYENMVFKLDAFFKGFVNFQNEFGKDKKYIAAVHALSAICYGLGIELEDEELFIIYHLKDQGKFRKREKDLHAELKNLWAGYPYKEFAMADVDFSHSLKNLMRAKFIDYRRGNLHINQSLIIRFKDRY
ncbi:hypothetical protein [Halobacteriovorax sp. RT-2-6]|uniref:hypothetical protein n=1 Tax=unclassified Halobacteriovorax TaxID=2639665 RepID=UPI00399B9E51